MLLKLNTGIAAKGVTFLPGDIVEWACDADAERMLKRGLASRPTASEVKAAEGRIRNYAPPKTDPYEKWPPGELKPLKRSFSETD